MAVMNWHPMRAGDLLDAAFRGYRRFWGPSLAAYGCFCLPSALVSAGASALAQDARAPFIVRVDLLLLALALTLLSALPLALAEIVCARAVLNAARGEPATAGAVFARLRGHWWRLFTVALAKDFLIGLGLMACLVPGIVLAVNYAVAVPAAMDENLCAGEALRRSRALITISSSRGKTLLLLVLLSLMGYVVSLAMNAAMAGASAITSGFVNLSPAVLFTGPAGLWQNALAEAADRLFIPLGGLLWAYYFLDLKARREGADLVITLDGSAGGAGVGL
ncbi:MAG: hypothetical protein ACM3X6_04670 [Patescibacteria group bacterium]